MSDPVTTVTEAVEQLAGELDRLLDACTDPEGADVVQLLAELDAASKRLRSVTRDVELAAAQAMLDDELQAGDYYAERSRGTDRKAWQHDQWQADVRRKAVQARGLRGAQLVNADGELIDAGPVLAELLADVQAAHSSTGPRVTALRKLGLDARDYCESSPGAWHVRVQRRVPAEQAAERQDGAA